MFGGNFEVLKEILQSVVINTDADAKFVRCC